MFSSVGLFYCDLQIATVSGRVEIVYLKSTRGNVLLIDEIAILAYRNLSIRAGDTANSRRISTLTVRQHLFIGSNVDATILQAVEDFSARTAFTAGKLSPHCVNVVLHIGINCIPAGCVVSFTPGRVITQTPATEVSAAA
ncbi:hypothetical protein D3C76_933990 [compost metagenome]